MSYLNFPRLNFFGKFQADPSTVNNDPRHFDTETFHPSFQEEAAGNRQNGWWNPNGTGIFRLVDCAVTSLLMADGVQPDDEALTFHVDNADDRASAKIVDIDPDWQLASAIFGLTVTLRDRTGRVVMRGDFESTPFRDLWFNRSDVSSGDTAASAMFQSVLTNLRWDLPEGGSPFLHALKSRAEATQRLSIRFTTYGYIGDSTQPNFTYGKLVGSIGPTDDDEPRSFVLGRRFMPYAVPVPNAYTGSIFNPNATETLFSLVPPLIYQTATLDANKHKMPTINCFSGTYVDAAVLDDKTIPATFQLDLSNALQADSHFNLLPLPGLHCAVLTRFGDENGTLTQGAILTDSNDYVILGPINTAEGYQRKFAGIHSIPIPPHAQTYVEGGYPLALIQVASSQTTRIVLRETPNGLEVRAEEFETRLDPHDRHRRVLESTVWAACYGRRIPNPLVCVTVNPPFADDQTDNGPASAPVGTTPQAAMPTINIPYAALTITAVPTEKPGRATVTIKVNPDKVKPRAYIDTQFYALSYNFLAQDGSPTAPFAVQHQFDNYAILVFDNHAPIKNPTWADVQPILQQYANLYPVMSKGLFDFSQQAIADANAHALYTVFSNNNFDDPDYMPVTRDLAFSKRETLANYFRNIVEKTPRDKNTERHFRARCPFGFDQAKRG